VLLTSEKPLLDVEPLSDERTPLADFVNSLLERFRQIDPAAGS
jgi:hypothetical protein